MADPPLREAGPEHLFACVHPVGGERGEASEIKPSISISAMVGSAPNLVSSTGTTPVLELRKVVKTYPVSMGGSLRRKHAQLSATADVSFAVGLGETFGLVGESGCGKSMIARMIVALERPSAGQVLVGGVELTSLSRSELRRRRRNVHLMFQDPSASMNGRMRAPDIFREPFVVQGVGDRRSQDASIAELLDRVGLARSMAGRYPHELSGGQTPKPRQAISTSARRWSSAATCRRARRPPPKPKRQGLRSLVLTTHVEGEAREVGRLLAGFLREVAASGHPLPRPCALIAGGETTVAIRGTGRGGRNQEVALAGAFGLRGLQDVLLASIGTDGSDGPTDAAGAVVDGTTLHRAAALGLDPRDTWPTTTATRSSRNSATWSRPVQQRPM